MARKPRIEIEGGLYHIITRGNNRQSIFHDADDYNKILSLFTIQKSKRPFYLYAYCLMPNHIHLLAEMQHDPLSHVMHRVLTGYGQYYNRRYERSGHVLQGRYKAILCDSDTYLAELVRYIHLNPVRAKMVRRADHYAYSSHRDYVGIERTALVDVEPVLRRFGGTKKKAIERYRLYVSAGRRLGHEERYYRADEGRVLGDDEFVDRVIHRIGEVNDRRENRKGKMVVDAESLMTAAAAVTGKSRKDIPGDGKKREHVLMKEAIILIGKEGGLTNARLARVLGVDSSVISRRYDAAKADAGTSPEMKALIKRIKSLLIATSQA